MDIRKIKKLIDLLEDSDLSEIEIQEGEESIRLSRASQIQAAPVAAAVAPVQAPVAPAASATELAPTEDSKPELEGEAITSPMVGTFYSASKPESPDFVKVGDQVKQGDVLCIVEAMKIFNQIEADKSGTVISILKQSGDPVEFGESLFMIK